MRAFGALWVTFIVAFTFYKTGVLDLKFYTNTDPDSFYSAQVLSLLLGGELHYIHHPGTTLVGGMAILSRPALKKETEWLQTKENAPLSSSEMNRVDATLDRIAFNGRLIELFSAIGLFLLFYFLFSYLISSWLAASFLTFLAASDSFHEHLAAVRPDLPANALLVLAGWGLYGGYRKQGNVRLVLWIASGLALGFALYSKIQIIPSMGLLGIAGIFWASRVSGQQSVWTCGFLWGLSLIASPWWFASRPANLVRFDSGDYAHAYGHFPLTHIAVFIGFVVLIALGYGISFSLRNSTRFAWRRATSLIACLYIGFCIATYAVLLPASHSLRHYWESSHLMVYASLSNLFGMRFMEAPKKTILTTLGDVLAGNRAGVPYFGVSLMELALIALLFSTILLRKNKTPWISIALFSGGIINDFLSSRRAVGLHHSYLIYSNVFYAVSFFVSLHVLTRQTRKNRVTQVAIAGIGMSFLILSWKPILYMNGQVPYAAYRKLALEQISAHVPEFYNKFFLPSTKSIKVEQ